MESNVEHLGSLQFQIKTRGHSIVSDQPFDQGGYDEGMTPPELLLASLGSCVGFYASQYLRKRKLSIEGTRVRVTCDQAKDPVAGMDNFKILAEVPVELSQEHRKGVYEAVEHCLVKNALLHAPSMSLKVAAVVPSKK
jgi:putative redox protein